MFGALVGDLLSSCFGLVRNNDFDLKIDYRSCHFSDISRLLLHVATEDECPGETPIPLAYAVAVAIAYKAHSEKVLKADLQKKAFDLGLWGNDAQSFMGYGMMIYQALIGKVKSKIEENVDGNPIYAKAFSAFRTTSTIADAIRTAIRSSDDTDCNIVAFMAGALAEAYYGIDYEIIDSVFPFLSADEWKKINNLIEESPLSSRGKYHIALKYEKSLLEDMPDFCQDFLSHSAAKDYDDVLEKHGLGWNERSMLNADFMNLGESAIVSLITGAIRAESFSAGAIKTFLPVLPMWLNRLNDFNSPIYENSGMSHSKAVNEIHIDIKGLDFVETMDCSLGSISICTETSLGRMRHEYSFDDMEMKKLTNMLLHRFSIMVGDPGWLDADMEGSSNGYSSHYEIKATCNDGSTVIHHGMLDRVHVPGKAFCSAITLLTEILGRLGFGRITDLSLFNSVWKEGEVKYCGCIFHEGGKLYHYRTTDPRINVGNEVVVPVGDDGDHDIVTVKTIEFCRWDDTPYPLEKTKEIIGLASENGQLLDDEDLLLLESDD